MTLSIEMVRVEKSQPGKNQSEHSDLPQTTLLNKKNKIILSEHNLL